MRNELDPNSMLQALHGILKRELNSKKMANPNRKDAVNKSRQQRKRTHTRKSKQIGTKQEVTPGTPTKQPSSSEVKEGKDQNGKAARKSRNQAIFPKVKMGDRKGGGNYGTTANGLVSPQTAGITFKTFDAAALASGDFSQPAAGLEGLTIKEATKRRTLIAKQKNQLDVMYDKYARAARSN